MVSFRWVVWGYGFFCQVAQALLFRELFTLFQGNELSFGIILAGWLFWSGVGSQWQAHRMENLPHLPAYRVYTVYACLSLPSSIGAIRLVRGLLPIPPGGQLAILDIFVLSFLILSPLCVLTGSIFVLLARAWRESAGLVDTYAGGKAYIAESVGTAVGGLGFSLLFARAGNSTQTAVGTSLVFGFLLLVGERLQGQGLPFFGERTASTRKKAWILRWMVFPIALGATLLLVSPLENLTYRVQWALHAPDYRLLQYRSSRYGVLTLSQRENQYVLHQSGQLLFTMAADSTGAGSDPSFEEQSALQYAHVVLLQHPDPKQIFLAGGGLRGTLRGILAHPVHRVDYVELDPDLLNLALPFVPGPTAQALKDPRVRVRVGDARRLLARSQDTYDCVVLDLPDPTTAALNRFYTEEFFRTVASRLTTGGVLSLRLSSTPELRGTPTANRNATLYHTLRKVFPRVLAVGEHTLYFFSSLSVDGVTHQAETLQRRYIQRLGPDAIPSPLFLENLFMEGPLLRTNWVLHHHGREPESAFRPPARGPLVLPSLEELEGSSLRLPPPVERYFINTDFRPIGFFHSLHFWSSLTRADQSALLSRLLTVHPLWVLPWVLVPLGITRFLRSRDRGKALRWAIGVCVFTTGMSTMAMQVALLFSFQTQYGFVYEMIGLIIAFFMVGLALGTYLSHAFVRARASLSALTLAQGLIALYGSLVALGLPWIGGHSSAVFPLFSLLTLLCGTVSGVDFPLAAACLHKAQGKADRAVGTVYGMELWGACLGGLLAGTVVAPVLGILACFWLAALANLTAFVIIGWTGGFAHG